MQDTTMYAAAYRTAPTVHAPRATYALTAPTVHAPRATYALTAPTVTRPAAADRAVTGPVPHSVALEAALFVVTAGVGWLGWAAVAARHGQTPAMALRGYRAHDPHTGRPTTTLATTWAHRHAATRT